MSIADRLRNAGGDVDPPIRVRRLGEQDWLILDGRHRWVASLMAGVRGHPRDGGAVMDLYRYPTPQVFIPDSAVTRTEDGRLLVDWLGQEFEIDPIPEERTVHRWGGWPGWVALACIAGITVLIGGALCAGLILGAVRRWRERG